MKNNLFLYSLLIFMVIFMAGCATGIPQLPINNNLQGNESDQGNNQDESTGVPRVVFIELFNTDGCAASKAINPIIEEIVAEYENTEVILVEMAGWGKHATEETYERFKWYFPDKSELHTPSVCFNGLNQLFAQGFSLGGGGNSGNSGDEDVGDAGDNEVPEIVEVDITKPVITGSRAPLSNSFGWNNTDVTVSFSCADTGSVQSGIDINTVAGKTLTTEGKDQSVTNTGTCIDAAGNAADPVTVSNINIDKTPPVVTFTPGTGEYVLNQSITANWSATDALSGVVSPASGSVSIDTSSVGTKTFTLPAGKATDKAGNSSLKVTKSYSVIEDTEDLEMIYPQKWSGLTGFVAGSWSVEGSADTWLTNGFTEWRILRDYSNTKQVNESKAAVIEGNTKCLKAIWGVSSWTPTITATNWPDFRQAILDAAQWAQDNGVYEFQLGNEEELHVDGTTMTATQIITNLKGVATDVQAIFTNGNVSYSTQDEYYANWVSVGKGDIDLLAINIYKGGTCDNPSTTYQAKIDSLISAFGVNGTYITEFSLSTISLDTYSTDEAEQSEAVTEMINYIKASGITRAMFYAWQDDDFGVVKGDGTYRLLWNQALLNIPVKSTTFLATVKPDTIALMPK